jgi:hypothetical protein
MLLCSWLWKEDARVPFQCAVLLMGAAQLLATLQQVAGSLTDVWTR